MTAPVAANVTTTAGETFTAEESADLAFLIYKRWGRDLSAAHVAWRRLLRNSIPADDYERLVHASALYKREQPTVARDCRICGGEGWTDGSALVRRDGRVGDTTCVGCGGSGKAP